MADMNWYLRSDLDSESAYEYQSPDTPDKACSDSVYLRRMSETPGSALVTPPGLANDSSAATEYWFHRAYATPPLAAATIPAGQNWAAWLAPKESSTNLNHYFRAYCYLRRSGAKAAEIFGPTNAALEDSNASYVGRVASATNEAEIAVQAGDQIVLEVWSTGKAASSIGYIETFVYEGPTEIPDEEQTVETPGPRLVGPRLLEEGQTTSTATSFPGTTSVVTGATTTSSGAGTTSTATTPPVTSTSSTSTSSTSTSSSSTTTKTTVPPSTSTAPSTSTSSTSTSTRTTSSSTSSSSTSTSTSTTSSTTTSSTSTSTPAPGVTTTTPAPTTTSTSTSSSTTSTTTSTSSTSTTTLPPGATTSTQPSTSTTSTSTLTSTTSTQSSSSSTSSSSTSSSSSSTTSTQSSSSSTSSSSTSSTSTSTSSTGTTTTTPPPGETSTSTTAETTSSSTTAAGITTITVYVSQHTKFWAGYNEGRLVQHADDEINDGSAISGARHEVPGNPIGDAKESYQGFATVEVFREGVLLYSERPCEELKIITYPARLGENTHLVFRFRTKLGSAAYHDVDEYVYAVRHSAAGEGGA